MINTYSQPEYDCRDLFSKERKAFLAGQAKERNEAVKVAEQAAIDNDLPVFERMIAMCEAHGKTASRQGVLEC